MPDTLDGTISTNPFEPQDSFSGTPSVADNGELDTGSPATEERVGIDKPDGASPWLRKQPDTTTQLPTAPVTPLQPDITTQTAQPVEPKAPRLKTKPVVEYFSDLYSVTDKEFKKALNKMPGDMKLYLMDAVDKINNKNNPEEEKTEKSEESNEKESETTSTSIKQEESGEIKPMMDLNVTQPGDDDLDTVDRSIAAPSGGGMMNNPNDNSNLQLAANQGDTYMTSNKMIYSSLGKVVFNGLKLNDLFRFANDSNLYRCVAVTPDSITAQELDGRKYVFATEEFGDEQVDKIQQTDTMPEELKEFDTVSVPEQEDKKGYIIMIRKNDDKEDEYVVTFSTQLDDLKVDFFTKEQLNHVIEEMPEELKKILDDIKKKFIEEEDKIIQGDADTYCDEEEFLEKQNEEEAAAVKASLADVAIDDVMESIDEEIEEHGVQHMSSIIESYIPEVFARISKIDKIYNEGMYVRVIANMLDEAARDRILRKAMTDSEYKYLVNIYPDKVRVLAEYVTPNLSVTENRKSIMHKASANKIYIPWENTESVNAINKTSDPILKQQLEEGRSRVKQESSDVIGQ